MDSAELVIDGHRVVLRSSARRRKTISARRDEHGRIVVLLPADLSAAKQREWARTMVRRVVGQEERRRPPGDDSSLRSRADRLAAQYLDPAVGREVRAREVRWVSNQNHRWGSCSPHSGVIRLSDRMQSFPDWVVDHVIVHELAHLVELRHTPRFYALVARYPRTDRATGFLAGWTAALAHQTGGTTDAGTTDGGNEGELVDDVLD